MSDRYTDRETALVAYLTTALGATYWVSRAPSFANYPPGLIAVGVRWTGMDNDLDRGTSEPVSDNNSFSLRIVPNVVVDSDADTAINLAVDDICSALRTVSSYSVFGDDTFRPCGWRITRAQKGYIEKVGLVADVTLLALVEEEYTARLTPSLRLGYPFASVVQNAAAPSVSIIISNPGTAVLTISSVTAPSGFTASSVPASVAVGGTGTFTLTLNSTATVGTFTGTVTVNSNAGNLSADVSAEVTADSRLTRIPVYVLGGMAANCDVRPNTVYQWQLPDGSGGWTYQRANSPTYTAPTGSKGTYIYILLDDGKTAADITMIFNSTGVMSTIFETADFQHTRMSGVASAFYFTAAFLQGDVYHLREVVENTGANHIWIDATYFADCLYGDVSDWEPINPARVYFKSLQGVYGSLKFQTGATTTRVTISVCNAFTAADISQTIVNWDTCNANTFARVGTFDTVKRSQLTAAGEAAVVSLIAKGCAFTFKAE